MRRFCGAYLARRSELCRIVPEPIFRGRLTGSGPFRFVSQAQDDEVVLAANANYFGGAPEYFTTASACCARRDCARFGIAERVGGLGD